ncbi:MAG TPA: alpha/beta fold hydrolase [Dehalococcoidia bacterium]|nr:alpha/beta fold hydrolase [Dehalococcoidia bacterium]
MPLVKAGDINIEHYIEGEGPPLLMIRGFAADCSNWSPAFLGPLQERFTTIRFSNRGTGLTDKPDGPFTIRQMADDAANLLAALSIEKAHVFGVSMGGMIAQQLALDHADRVNGLVLGCTIPGGPETVGAGPEIVGMLMPEPGMSREDQVRKAWPSIVTPPFIESHRDFLEEMMRLALTNPTPVETFAKHSEAVREFDAFDRLPGITLPTLVIHGDSDVLLPHENGAVVAGLIPGSEFATIEGVGHMFFWEKPEEAADAIIEFLLRVPARA